MTQEYIEVTLHGTNETTMVFISHITQIEPSGENSVIHFTRRTITVLESQAEIKYLIDMAKGRVFKVAEEV